MKEQYKSSITENDKIRKRYFFDGVTLTLYHTTNF